MTDERRPLEAYRMRISGRVQGVGFRAFAWREARSRALVGYARNLPDGSVEVYAEGELGALEQLRQRLSRGPTWARVDQVTVERLPAQCRHKEFDIVG
jgi:acylphosphatase